jgi:nitrogen-specific signal transduction histidine kinase
VREHGGEIVVDSELGRGTVFRVVLPLTPPATAGAGAPHDGPAEPPVPYEH